MLYLSSLFMKNYKSWIQLRWIFNADLCDTAPSISQSIIKIQTHTALEKVHAAG